jgi:hypothetical protein
MIKFTYIDLKPTGWTRLYLWSAALFVLVSRFLTLAGHVGDSESVNFALALWKYDISMLQPHLPGFPVYVFIAGLFKALRLPAATALCMPGVLSSALAVFPLYFLCRRIYGVGAARLALVLYAFNPALWIAACRPAPHAAMLFPFLYGLRMVLRNLLTPEYLRRQTRFLSMYAGSIAFGILFGISLSYVALLFPIVAAALYGLIKLNRKKVLLETLNGLIAGTCLWAVPFLFKISIADFFNYKVNLDAHAYVDPLVSSGLPWTARAGLFVENLLGAGLGAHSVVPLLGVCAGAALLIRASRPKFKNNFLPIFFFPMVFWIFLRENLYNVESAVLLVPLCLIFVCAGLGTLKKRVLFYGISSVLVAWSAFTALGQAKAFHKTVPPQAALAGHISTRMDPDKTLIFCGNSVRLIKYLHPEYTCYGIKDLAETEKPFFQKQMVSAEVYLTSEVTGGREGLVEKAAFSGPRLFYGAQNRIVLFKAGPGTGP